MKVRSSNFVDHEVKAFISAGDFILPISDYKPVVESIGSDAASSPPQWEDVTEECVSVDHHLGTDYSGIFRDKDRVCFVGLSGYRLVKEQLWRIKLGQVLEIGKPVDEQLAPQFAFRVERRKP